MSDIIPDFKAVPDASGYDNEGEDYGTRNESVEYYTHDYTFSGRSIACTTTSGKMQSWGST